MRHDSRRHDRVRRGAEADILIEAPAWLAALPAAEAVVARAAAATLERAARAPGRCVVLLDDDARLRALNKRFRGLDKATNVLAFPAQDRSAAAAGHSGPVATDEQPPHWGDVAIAYETTAREAKEAGRTLADHLSHLVVHGLLHLFGHDHQDDGEARTMEALEREILHGLGIGDPYRDEDGLAGLRGGGLPGSLAR